MLKLFKGIFSKKFSKPEVLVRNETAVGIVEKPELLEQERNLAVYITDVTHNSVSVIAIGGSGTGDYEYGKSTNDFINNIGFQPNPVFSGLESEKTYHFSVRKKGDGTYTHSRISGRKTATTLEDPQLDNQPVKLLKLTS